MRRLKAAVLTGLFVAMFTEAFGVMDIGLQKQLMIDDYMISEKQNVAFKLGTPVKQGIVMEPELDTDFYLDWTMPDGSRVALEYGFHLTVVRNEEHDIYQMYYSASGGVGYAESEDGLNWTRPAIGFNGSNIIKACQGFSCSIDPNLPWGHAEKYKAAFDSKLDDDSRVCLAHSADGKEWIDYNNGNWVSHRAADTQNQIIWDPYREKFLLLTRTDMGGAGGDSENRSQRVMVHTQNNDLINYPAAWEIISDEIAVDDPLNEKNEWGLPRLQFNSMTLFIYEGIYFGLMDVYSMDAAGSFDGYDYVTRHDDDVMDFYIGGSREGIDYDKSWIHNRKPFLPRGPDSSFDKDGVKPPSTILTINDEHLIYYSGMSERHYSRGRHHEIALAKLRLDGFICLEAGSLAGTVITKSFIAEGDKLEVNVKAESGSIQIELLDASDNVISGYTATHSGVDELRLIPAWSGGGTIESLKGDTVKIKFTLTDARLYAFAQVGTSFKLTSAKSRIAAGADTELSIERIGGLTGSVTWSASGGAISSENDSGAVFTSDGSVGTFTVTAVIGEITKTVDIEVFDPAEYDVKINCGGDAVGEWVSDGGFASGGESYNWEESVDVSGIENAGPAQIYETVRHTSPHSYTFPVVDGDYIVRIHFVDRMTSLHRDVTYNIEATAVESGISIPEGPEVREYNVTVLDGNGLTIECVGNGESDVFEAGIEVTYDGGSATEASMAGFNTGVDGLRVRKISGGKYRISALSGKEPFRVRIVSVNGTVVESFSGRCTGVWTPECASGLYFIDVVSGDRRFRERVLIQR